METTARTRSRVLMTCVFPPDAADEEATDRPPRRRPTTTTTTTTTPPSDDGPACDNDQRDGAETDVDCGGGTCDPCRLGRDCEIDGDCESGLCDGVCRRVVARAHHHRKNARARRAWNSYHPTSARRIPADCRAAASVMNEMCLGDGTCGTDENAGNCYPTKTAPTTAEPFAVYRALWWGGKSKKKGNAMPGYGIALLVLFLLSLACLCCCFVAYALRNPSRNRTDVKPRNLEPMKGRRGSKHRRRSHHAICRATTSTRRRPTRPRSRCILSRSPRSSRGLRTSRPSGAAGARPSGIP